MKKILFDCVSKSNIYGAFKIFLHISKISHLLKITFLEVKFIVYYGYFENDFAIDFINLFGWLD